MRGLLKFFAFISRLLAVPVVLTILFFNIFIVPNGSLGVLTRSDKNMQLILPSGYHWRWDGFVPSLWNFSLVSQQPRQIEVTFTESLRYANYLSNPENFRFLLSLRLEYVIQPKDMSVFLQKFDSRQNEKMDIHIREQANMLLRNKFFSMYPNELAVKFLENNFTTYLTAPQGFSADWQQSSAAQFFSLKQVEVLSLSSPPAEIYHKQVRMIDGYMQQQAQLSLQRLKEREQREQTQEQISVTRAAELSHLHQMGELIRENPYILEYLKIEKLHPNASVVVVEGSRANTFVLPQQDGEAKKK